MAFLGAEGKLTRFGDFNRVAEWIDRGAPGAKPAARRTRHASTSRDVRGRVAAP